MGTGLDTGWRRLTGVHRRFVQAAVAAGIMLAPAVSAAQAAAAQAAAATLAVDRPCYVNKPTKTGIHQAPVVVTGTGYVPGDSVTITSGDGSVNQVLQADRQGSIAGTIGAPTPFFKRPGAQVMTLTAADYSAGGPIQATTLLQVADLAVATVPARAMPSRKVTWYFSGFLPGHSVYGHYLRHRREVARARFGRATGPCGLLRTRALFFPGGHQRYSSYGLQFDDSRPYRPRSSPRIVTGLNTF